jgi:hypothetical protein
MTALCRCRMHLPSRTLLPLRYLNASRTDLPTQKQLWPRRVQAFRGTAGAALGIGTLPLRQYPMMLLTSIAFLQDCTTPLPNFPAFSVPNFSVPCACASATSPFFRTDIDLRTQDYAASGYRLPYIAASALVAGVIVLLVPIWYLNDADISRFSWSHLVKAQTHVREGDLVRNAKLEAFVEGDERREGKETHSV